MAAEPTSGLDATTALQLLGALRKLAEGGRAVITTIHQPASRLYQMLDKLMLLSEGHIAYYGKASWRWMFQPPRGLTHSSATGAGK